MTGQTVQPSDRLYIQNKQEQRFIKTENVVKYLPIVGTLLLGVIILVIQIKTSFQRFDEGFAVYYAERILRGDIPYKDFWAVYPPGQFYTLALIFKIFGTSLLVSRIYDTLVRLIIACSLWVIAKKITDEKFATLSFIVSVILLSSSVNYSYAVFPSLALSLLAVLSYIEYVDTARHRWQILSGMLIGLASLFRWDIGLYAGICIIGTILLVNLFKTKYEGNLKLSTLSRAHEFIPLIGGSLIVALPVYGYISFISGIHELWNQVIWFPTAQLSKPRWL